MSNNCEKVNCNIYVKLESISWLFFRWGRAKKKTLGLFGVFFE